MSDAPGPPRGPAAPPADEPPQYTKYRARPRLLPSRGGDRLAPAPAPGAAEKPPRRRRRLSWKRALVYLVLAGLAWVLVSFLTFMLSAQIQSGKVSDETKAALSDAGYPLTSANTILVLGSDQRAKGTKEPGASTEGPSRSDSILLLRVGGGHSGRLSIARDTIVDIPGHGRGKINAAYAYGGAALSIRTIRQYLGIPINHVIEVDFENFPKLIDAMGGITFEGGCVVSRINGGARNGGYTLRLRKGKSHLDGEQALALSRTRKNLCNPREDDLTRARRQQKVLAAMKSKMTTPWGLAGVPHGSFYRLPLVAWQTPRAFRSDMGGPTLLGVFGAMATGGSPTVSVLGTPSGVVPDELKQRMVERFVGS